MENLTLLKDAVIDLKKQITGAIAKVTREYMHKHNTWRSRSREQSPK